ncbi:MAG: hypothetical protein IPO91_03635 [Chloroflexi bacterium]|nr:hypothetical protein [Chloroflexota bacterium]
MFEPFHQANPGATAPLGSGLSLAVAKRLVERHEGVMWLHSTSGRGSTFQVAVQRRVVQVLCPQHSPRLVKKGSLACQQ